MGSCDWFCVDAPPLSHTITQQYQHHPRQPGEGRTRGGREGRGKERREGGGRGERREEGGRRKGGEE